MKIASPKDVYSLSNAIIRKKSENLIIFYLNKNGKVIEKKLIKTKGKIIFFSLNQIFSPTLKNKARFIILCHNHPSGNLSPSNEDLKSTQKIVEAGKTLGISIIDHVIVTSQGYYSVMQQAKVLLPVDHLPHL